MVGEGGEDVGMSEQSGVVFVGGDVGKAPLGRFGAVEPGETLVHRKLAAAS